MLKFTTTHGGAAVSVAVLAIALGACFASAAPQAKAEPQITPVEHQHFAKADRLPAGAKAAACSFTNWPYYDQDCRFDLRTPAGEARTVRVIALR